MSEPTEPKIKALYDYLAEGQRGPVSISIPVAINRDRVKDYLQILIEVSKGSSEAESQARQAGRELAQAIFFFSTVGFFDALRNELNSLQGHF